MKLLEIDEDLIIARTKYTGEDLMEKFRKRKEFIKFLKDRAIGILNLKRERQ